MADLRARVPGQSLIEELLRQWDLGAIHVDAQSNGIVIDEEAEGWYRGVLGERRVAALLDQLGEGWTVIHSIPIGERGSDIDHLVVGPPGVFTVNTKFSPGKDVWVAGRGMFVGGSKQHYVVNALYEARRASTYLTGRCGLTVPVTGIVVFVDPARITMKAPPGGGEADPPIRVVRDTELLNELYRRREFSDEQVQRIVDAAVQPATWSNAAAASANGAHLALEFQALEEEVGPRLALPRGQVRVTTTATRHPGYGRTSSGPAAPRVGAKASRSRRRRPSVFERFFTGFVVPVAGLILFWVIFQQVLNNWIASH